MPQLSDEARDLTWLIGNFEKQTPGVAHAMVVSADGLPVAVSDRLDRPMADQLAAIASGLASLTQGAASLLDCGLLKQTVVEMDRLADRHVDPRRLLPCRAGRLPPATWAWSPTRWPCSSPASARSSPPRSGPNCKPPSQHERPTSHSWRPVRHRHRRRAHRTSGKPAADPPALLHALARPGIAMTSADQEPRLDHPRVRPYAITGGRTRPPTTTWRSRRWSPPPRSGSRPRG